MSFTSMHISSRLAYTMHACSAAECEDGAGGLATDCGNVQSICCLMKRFKESHGHPFLVFVWTLSIHTAMVIVNKKLHWGIELILPAERHRISHHKFSRYTYKFSQYTF